MSKILRTLLSLILIAAGGFGLFSGIAGVRDALRIRAYKAEDMASDLDRINEQFLPGIQQMEENLDEYLEAVKLLEEGQKALAEGRAQLDAGKAQLDEADLTDDAAQIVEGRAQLAASEASLSEGEALLAEGEAQLASYEQAEVTLTVALCRMLSMPAYQSSGVGAIFPADEIPEPVFQSLVDSIRESDRAPYAPRFTPASGTRRTLPGSASPHPPARAARSVPAF